MKAPSVFVTLHNSDCSVNFSPEIDIITSTVKSVIIECRCYAT